MTFRDVFYQPGDTPVFCYRSGAAVYEEVLYRGCLAACGMNAAGYPLNVLTNCPSRINPDEFAEPSVFSIEADGVCLDYSWELVDFTEERTETATDAVLTLASSVKPIRVKLHTVLDGTAALTRFIELENTGTEHIAVSRLALLGGALERLRDIDRLTSEKDVTRYYSYGYAGDDRWGGEGSFAWHPLTPGIHTVDCRFSEDRHRHPAMFVRNELLGTVVFMQLGWSGGCRFSLDYAAYPNRNDAKLAYAAELSGYSPLLLLRPGETFTLPEAHIGIVHGGLDDAVNAMNAHVRRSVLHTAHTKDCLVGAGMGAEHDMMPDTTKSFIDQFAEMGGEVFIIDAGWVCPPGNPIDWGGCNGINRPDPDRYPGDTFAELRRYCHEKGLKFGLWTEIERIGSRAPVFTEHPEWRACDRFGRQSGGYLDLTVPEAAAWAENEAARIIEEYGPELFRVDYNVSHNDYFLMRDTDGCGQKECLALRQFSAVYTLYRNLRKRFPDVIFENCAGGGGRTDLGQMRSFDHTWVSDWQKAPGSVAITNGMTLVLPPERVDRLFAGMGCHETGSLDLHMRNTMLCHMSLNVISPAAARINGDAMEFVKHSVQLYKDKIRPILPDCLIYHHTPESAKTLTTGFSAAEIAAPDGTRGAITAFTLCTPGGCERQTVLYPRGIDPAFTYTVTLDNRRSSFVMTGAELMNHGLRINIPAALSSELILYERTEK